MNWEDWYVFDSGFGEVCMWYMVIGVNYVDIYYCGGIFYLWLVFDELVVIGFEGVGIVEGVGEGVIGFKIGDCVVYGILLLGFYFEVCNYFVDKLLYLFEGLDDK